MRNKTFLRLATGLIVLGAWTPIVSAQVTYRLDFAGAWSAATHPGAFPGSAHFTELVGATHSDAVSFWELGALASPGIERMAELGSTGTLLNEVQTAISLGTATASILGPDLFGLPNSTFVSFEVSVSHPLITLVTMIAPSPDWFVGVSGLSLRENDQWLGRIVVDLQAYDAGTEEGMGFSLSNPATSPQEPITKITTGPLAGLPSLGTFTLTIQPNDLPGDFDLSGQVDDVDLLAWKSGFGNFADGLATVIDGDANEDGYVDGADFLLWQRNYDTSLPAVATASVTVPEAESVVLLLVGWSILVALKFSHPLNC